MLARSVACTLGVTIILFFAPLAVHGDDDQLSPVIPIGEELIRDGLPMRFWGVNVNLQSWNNARSVDRMAERIKQVGFNAVRLWPNHRTFYKSDVRKDVRPPLQGFEFHSYKKGDSSQLDLFDRMVFRCRQNGLSIYMTATMYYPPIYPAAEYADLVQTNDRDRKEWMEAVSAHRWEKGTYDPWWALHYIDERFQAIWMKHASLFLNHVNLYTGLRNADDNNIVMWQLHNESRFIRKFMLDNEYRKPSSKGRPFPDYFQKKLQQKYNEYLIEKYRTTKNLIKAWGAVQPGESFLALNIDAGAKGADNVEYNPERVADFTAFIVKLTKDWNNRFTRFLRGHADERGIAVTAIATDTFGWASLPYYSTVHDGSMVSFGNYPNPRIRHKKGANAKSPWTPKLGYTGAWGPFDFTRPYGKPAVIYEINYNQFSLYDAELPWLLATFASWQNINGVFFYFWNAPFKREQPAPYGQNVFTLRGKEIWGDEVYSAAIQAAGEAYLNRLLPIAAEPTVFSFSEDIVSDPAWKGWSFSGKDTHSSNLEGMNPNQIGSLRKRIVGAAFSSGSRVRIVADQNTDLKVIGAEPKKMRLGGDIQFSPGLIWRGSSEILKVDLPEIKVFVGFPRKPTISWSDGISVEVLNLEELGSGPLHKPFVAISLVSLDGQPLANSNTIRFVAVSHSFNQDMSWQRDQDVLNPGDGNVVTRRVLGNVRFPERAGRKVRFRDFTFKTLFQADASRGFALSSELPVYDALITVE